MENGYINIDIIVRRAQQQRSDAMSEIFSHGWASFKHMVSHLVHHTHDDHSHLAHS